MPSRPAPSAYRVPYGSVASYAVGRLVPGLLLLVSVPIWLRVFGAASYGVFSIGFATALAVASFTTGWLRQAALRFAGRDGYGLSNISISYVLSSVAAAAAGSLVVVALVVGAGPGILAAVTVFAATFSIYLLTQTAAQRDGRAGRFTAAEIARTSVALVVSLVLAATSLDGASALLLSATTGNLVAIFLTRTRRADAAPSSMVAREVWRFGWPLSVWLGVSSLTLYVDRFILESHVDPTVLGRYAAAADLIVRGFAMLVGPVLLAVHPAVMKLYNRGDKQVARQMLNRTMIWTALGVLLAVVLVSVLGQLALESIVGATPPSRATVTFLALGGGLWQFALLAHKGLELEHRTKEMMFLAGAALLVEMVVGSLLVDTRGTAAVAFGLFSGGLLYVGWALGRSIQLGRR